MSGHHSPLLTLSGGGAPIPRRTRRPPATLTHHRVDSLNCRWVTELRPTTLHRVTRGVTDGAAAPSVTAASSSSCSLGSARNSDQLRATRRSGCGRGRALRDLRGIAPLLGMRTNGDASVSLDLEGGVQYSVSATHCRTSAQIMPHGSDKPLEVPFLLGVELLQEGIKRSRYAALTAPAGPRRVGLARSPTACSPPAPLRLAVVGVCQLRGSPPMPALDDHRHVSGQPSTTKSRTTLRRWLGYFAVDR